MKTQTTLIETCRSCEEVYQLEVYAEDLQAFENGKLIQEVMPYVPNDARELLISGICGSCFDGLFENKNS